MKVTANYLSLLVSIMLMSVFAACGSDDEPTPAPDSTPAGFDSPVTFKGTIKVINLETQETESSEASYTLTFNLREATVNIMCNSARFIAAMPRPMDILIPNVPLIVDNQKFAFAASGPIDPMIGNDPYPAFPISDVSGEGNIGAQAKMTFSFVCDVNTPNFSGKYRVEAINLVIEQ